MNRIRVLAAVARKDKVALIESYRDTIWNHLFKIIMTGAMSQEYKHWVKELVVYARRLGRTKCKAPIDAETYYNLLWDNESGTFCATYSYLLSDFKKEYMPVMPRRLKRPSVNQVYESFDTFMKGYSQLIASGTVIDTDNIERLLVKARIKY